MLLAILLIQITTGQLSDLGRARGPQGSVQFDSKICGQPINLPM